ncbi:MAG: hypothetical protein REI64_16610 [Pedobacter sp.]|uniref:hypothetical protein n=1 Tax=Pedobacter sp. TaxID=1411316 RepID=UPI0028086639|nr:hypothetical protein [Pedobacter sp.]MDQ8006427.1 hypothetical protein [Pedobacter sp.]
MKKIATFLSLCLTASVGYAQTSEQKKDFENGKNEIKINLFSSVFALPELNYERLLEDNMSVGLALGFGIGNEDDFSEYRLLAIPHYRVYFGKKNCSGFFIEGNAALANVREERYGYYYDTNYGYVTVGNGNTTKFNFGLGAAVGAKFLTRNGFVGEVYGGVGRFLGGNRSIEAYPRVGITIGKRF